MNYFITGTDTGVGKTHVTAALLRELRRRSHHAAAFKPIACGVGGRADAKTYRGLMDDEVPLDLLNPVYLKHPLAPSVAAALERRTINLPAIHAAYTRLTTHYSPVLVEGAGGLLVPVKRHYFIADLIRQLDLPVIIIARLGLGTINHTLLTLEALGAGYIGDFDTGTKALTFTQAPALGIVDVFGNMNVRSNSNLNFQVGGYNSGLASGDPEFDQYIVTGNVNYAGRLTVQLINGLSPQLGDSWALIQAGGTISFSGTTAMPTLGGGLSWNVAVVSGSSEFGSGGSSLVISVVPAPSAFALVGLAGIVTSRRRRA